MNIKNRSGFTLVELLVIFAIIAILAALLLPPIARHYEKQRQLSLAEPKPELVGNMTFLRAPVGKVWHLSANSDVTMILREVDVFERTNPFIDVTSRQLIAENDVILGVILNHRPSTNAPPVASVPLEER